MNKEVKVPDNPSPISQVCYGFDPTAGRDVGILFLKEISKAITNGTCPSHKNGVVIVYERE